jgi:cellulose biosynthesis protein BcsQ
MAIKLRKEKPPGEIITFYSYKGGTGRTMALANVGCLLARQFQQKILLIDWDLEAPGLHWYFEQHDLSAESESYNQRLQDQPGLMELFERLSTTISHPSFDPENAEFTAALIQEIQLEQYIFETYLPNIYLLKSGRFDDDYSTKVNSFQWVEFYNHSPTIFRLLAEYFKHQFAYTLIDSRTGVTDTSGICTALMPEKLVTIFTPNRQSLSGVLEIAKKATDYRKQSNDLRPLIIFPVPSRVETSETSLKSQWRFGEENEGLLGYQPAFEQLLQQVYNLTTCDLDDYFNEVQIQHFPRYSYGEEIAVLEEDEGDRLSLARSYESLLKQLLSAIPPWELKRSEGTRSAFIEEEKIADVFLGLGLNLDVDHSGNLEFSLDDLEARLQDLEKSMTHLEEHTRRLQAALDNFRRSSEDSATVQQSKGFQNINELVNVLRTDTRNSKQSIEQYKREIRTPIWTHEEINQEYANINEQIIKIGNYTRVIQVILTDLPEFIRRSS